MPREQGTVVSVNVSPGGVPKLPVAGATVSASGVEGDRQRNLAFHGGPDRALCLFSMDRIEALHRISQKRHPGWSRVYARVVGTGEFRVGDAVTAVETR